ncbi:MAG: hypothetical protein Q8S84_09460 [bacterium]|nr:hypothetical protein [bacterium]
MFHDNFASISFSFFNNTISLHCNILAVVKSVFNNSNCLPSGKL